MLPTIQKRTIEYSGRAEKAALDANDHALHANVLSANSRLDQYMCNVRMWADDVCDAVSVAIYALGTDSLRQDELLSSSLHKISALVDRGRWFFPNLWSDEYGQHKEPAYRGIRQPILECIVEAHDLIKLLRETKDASHIESLIRCKRVFVSEVQQVLNPRRRQDEVTRINEQFAIAEKLRAISGTASD